MARRLRLPTISSHFLTCSSAGIRIFQRFQIQPAQQQRLSITSSARIPQSKNLSPFSKTEFITVDEAAPTEPVGPRLSLTFTCTVPACETRSSHTFTRRSYEKGIVLVQCPGCKNRYVCIQNHRCPVSDILCSSHLIADHLGWFKESTDDGKLRTIEDVLRARGERVRRGRLDAEGVVEYVED